jgi:hypothetical protein
VIGSRPLQQNHAGARRAASGTKALLLPPSQFFETVCARMIVLEFPQSLIERLHSMDELPQDFEHVQLVLLQRLYRLQGREANAVIRSLGVILLN